MIKIVLKKSSDTVQENNQEEEFQKTLFLDKFFEKNTYITNIETWNEINVWNLINFITKSKNKNINIEVTYQYWNKNLSNLISNLNCDIIDERDRTVIEKLENKLISKDINGIISDFKKMNTVQKHTTFYYLIGSRYFDSKQYGKMNIALNTKILKDEQYLNYLLINFLI